MNAVEWMAWMSRYLTETKPAAKPRVSNLRARLRELPPGESVTFETIEQARSAAAGCSHIYGKTFRRSGQTIERLS